MTFGRFAAEAVKTVIKITKVSFFTIIRKNVRSKLFVSPSIYPVYWVSIKAAMRSLA